MIVGKVRRRVMRPAAATAPAPIGRIYVPQIWSGVISGMGSSFEPEGVRVGFVRRMGLLAATVCRESSIESSGMSCGMGVRSRIGDVRGIGAFVLLFVSQAMPVVSSVVRAAEIESAGTVPFIFDDNRVFAELTFVRPDGALRKAVAFWIWERREW